MAAEQFQLPHRLATTDSEVRKTQDNFDSVITKIVEISGVLDALQTQITALSARITALESP